MIVWFWCFLNFIRLTAVIFSIARDSTESKPLQTYNISGVTVSGISSGGYMAVQFHIAYSSIVHGAAIFAGVNSYVTSPVGDSGGIS
jgi:hypothetical protein